MRVKNIFIRKIFFLPLLLAIISCSNEKSWKFSDGVEYPEGTKLSRAEDGVILSNGTLIVADQRYGLSKIDLSGNVTPFGGFESLDYEHNPPKVESGPNGVHLTPDKQYVAVSYTHLTLPTKA